MNAQLRRGPSRMCRIALVAGLAVPAWAPLAGIVTMAGATPALAAPDDGAGQSLPISGITLYRSGVGLFQRRGLVEGSQDVQLRFKTDQINDILKSMTILDLNGGEIEGVSYGSKEPLQRRLASFGVDLSDEPPLGTILARLRGAPVRFTTADATINGTILGGETRPQAQGQAAQPIMVPYINVLTDTGIRSVNLTTIVAVDLLDKDLNAELGKALAALAEHRADRTKTVDISLRGQGARQVVVGYIHEMPVWKTSYRLILPDGGEAPRDGKKGPPADSGGQPTIQGWAIVENTTDEDWKDVRLSLVSGRPVSFQMDLYEPLYVERPEIPVPTVPGVAPRVFEGGAVYEKAKELAELAVRAPGAPPPSAKAGRASADRMMRDAGESGAGGGQSPFQQEQDERLSAEDMANYAAKSRAQAVESGEVFQFQLGTPITVERQRSAMLPIITSAIDGRRVSIFNPADGSDHPMRGVEIKNNTGLQLMPGPISVFDGAAYAGDAQIGHVTAGDKRLLAYAVDLDVMGVVKDESFSTIQKIKVVNGLLEQTIKQQFKRSYAFDNKDTKRARTLLIEHSKMNGWDLVEPKKPAEETKSLYRFELPVEASKAASLAVVQERTDLQRIGLVDCDFNWLLEQSRAGKASQKVIDAVKQAADYQRQINDSQRRIGEMDQQRQAIDADQNRLRQNMNAVGRDSDLYRRYMTKLGEQETALEKLLASREAETANLDKLHKQLEDYLRNLTVE